MVIRDNKSCCQIILKTWLRFLQKSTSYSHLKKLFWWNSTLEVKGHVSKKQRISSKINEENSDKYIYIVEVLEPFKYLILVSEVKFDLRGQRSFFEKGVLLNKKHCWNGLMKISFMVYKLEPSQDFILVKSCISSSYTSMQNFMEIL